MGVEPGAFPRAVERDTQRLRRRCRGSCFDLHTQELRGFWGGLGAANSSSLAGVLGPPEPMPSALPYCSRASARRLVYEPPPRHMAHGSWHITRRSQV